MQLYSWCRVCDDLVDDKLAQKNHTIVRRFFDNFLDSVYIDQYEPSQRSREPEMPSGFIVRPVGETLVPSSGDYDLKEIVISSETVMDKLLPFEKISSFRCIKRIADKYHMKREELSELLDGFKLDMDMDRKEVKIATNEELIHYSCCVAASVGVMCCRIFGISGHRTDVYERARDMGIALQLTNIARYFHPPPTTSPLITFIGDDRDIVTDAKIGRVYVPLQWFESEAERQELLDHPWKNPARLRQFAETLIGLAEPYYRRAEEGVAMLPCEVGHTLLRSFSGDVRC